jgi:hypothetical protein
MRLHRRTGPSLVAALGFTLWATNGRAGPITDFFSLKASPATTLSGTGNTDDPVLGTLSTTAEGSRMMDYFPARTLTNVGGKIKLKFSVDFADNMAAMGNGSDNFRFALYDRNGEAQEATNSNHATTGTANTDAFRGYWFGVDTNPNATGVQGTIRERSGTGGNMDPFANASATLVGAPGGTAVPFALGQTYTGTMLLTLTGLNEITVTGSFSGNGGSNTFSFVDTTPVTKTYSVVGFLNGGGLSADQVRFHDVTIVPEPASWALGLVTLLGGLLVRRQR